MPRHSPEMFLSLLPATGVVLALDISKKRIGIATTDPARTMALPVQTIIRTKWAADMAALLAIVTDKSAIGLAIGLPINMDGKQGPAAQSALTVASKIDQFMADAGKILPYVMVDERLSTHAARDRLDGTSAEKTMEDQVAACLLLEQLFKI